MSEEGSDATWPGPDSTSGVEAELSTHVGRGIGVAGQLGPGRGSGSGTEDTLAASGDDTDDGSPTMGLAPTVPNRIGRYLIRRRIGSGGMGMVLGAYDPELDRELAIKLIHPRAAGRQEARTRMLREAKGLARLSHPNVVQVYDAGTVDGRVFIAMELLEGEPLSGWQAREGLDQTAILAVYLQAGQGLAAAHRVDLVHRDFKPDNVLVDREGQAKVLDFGLVRAIGKVLDAGSEGTEPSIELALDVTLDPSLLDVPEGRPRPLSVSSELDSEITHGGAVMGTPAYMSPEQWRGAKADARSDQFSFCVALWEALYGERPFAGRSASKLAASVCAGVLVEPPGNVRLPGPVRAGLERGLSSEAQDRFPSMDALLAELSRDDWTRRSLPLAIVATLAFALVAWGRFGAGPDAGGGPEGGPLCEAAGDRVTEVWSSEEGEAVAAAFATTGASNADLISDKVVSNVDRYVSRWRAEADDNCRATRVRHEQSEELLDLRTRCLEDKRMELQALVEVFADADAATVEAALTAVEGLPSLDACRADRVLSGEEVLPDDPQRAAEVQSARAALAGIRVRLDTGRFAEARSQLEELEPAVEALAFPAVEVEFTIARGRLAYRLDDAKTGQADLRAGYLGALAMGDDAMASRAALWLTELEASRGRLDFAELWAAQAQVLLERDSGGDPGMVAGLADTSSWIAHKRGDHDLAWREAERGLALLDAAELEAPMRRVPLYLDLGLAAYHQGDLAKAQVSFERALELATETVGRDSAMTTGALNNLAFTARGQGDLDRARALLEEAVVNREAEFGKDHATVGSALSNLADVDIDRGDGLAALVSADRGLRILEARRGPQALATLLARQRLGLAHGLVGEHAESIAELTAALEGAAAEPNPDLRLVAEVAGGLAVIHAAAGDSAKSAERLRQSLGAPQAKWDDLVYVGRYAEHLGQDELALAVYSHVEALAQAEGELDMAQRQRLALARLGWARVLEGRDPDKASRLLESIERTDLEGAPPLLTELDSQLGRLGKLR